MLSVFVAINTVMYVGLAVAKILPKVHPGDWVRRTYLRAETRGIHPEASGERGGAHLGRPRVPRRLATLTRPLAVTDSSPAHH